MTLQLLRLRFLPPHKHDKHELIECKLLSPYNPIIESRQLHLACIVYVKAEHRRLLLLSPSNAGAPEFRGKSISKPNTNIPFCSQSTFSAG